MSSQAGKSFSGADDYITSNVYYQLQYVKIDACVKSQQVTYSLPASLHLHAETSM